MGNGQSSSFPTKKHPKKHPKKRNIKDIFQPRSDIPPAPENFQRFAEQHNNTSSSSGSPSAVNTFSTNTSSPTTSPSTDAAPNLQNETTLTANQSPLVGSTANILLSCIFSSSQIKPYNGNPNRAQKNSTPNDNNLPPPLFPQTSTPDYPQPPLQSDDDLSNPFGTTITLSQSNAYASNNPFKNNTTLPPDLELHASYENF